MDEHDERARRRDEDERRLFDRAFDADSFAEVERVTHVVDPDSPLGRVIASARESWVRNGVPDPDDFTVTPIVVDLDDE